MRNQRGDIMRQVDEGGTFVVTRHGVPVGQLSPLRRNRFVAADEVGVSFSAWLSVAAEDRSLRREGRSCVKKHDGVDDLPTRV